MAACSSSAFRASRGFVGTAHWDATSVGIKHIHGYSEDLSCISKARQPEYEAYLAPIVISSGQVGDVRGGAFGICIVSV